MSVNISITTPDEPDKVIAAWTTDEDGTHHVVDNLTFDRVTDINSKRCGRWHKDATEQWTHADWVTAMVGELGEACNILKKLRRAESGTPNQFDPPEEQLREMLAEELADTFLYFNLLCNDLQIDLPAAVVKKFNETSVKYGFPERLP